MQVHSMLPKDFMETIVHSTVKTSMDQLLYDWKGVKTSTSCVSVYILSAV